MKLSYQILNAFTARPFGGNPAAVVPLASWLPEATMQAIAEQFNLSETAFYVPKEGEGGAYDIRYFTPKIEVPLCGHATLASAAVLFAEDPARDELTFHAPAGPLRALREADGWLTLDLPSWPVIRRRPDLPSDIFGYVEDIYETTGNCLLVTLRDEAALVACRPDLVRLGALPFIGAIVTAPGREVDVVSRFFAPAAGIAEDPVTGSAHCALAPFWAERFECNELTARQLSARRGDLKLRVADGRVYVSGEVQPFATGGFEIG